MGLWIMQALQLLHAYGVVAAVRTAPAETDGGHCRAFQAHDGAR